MREHATAVFGPGSAHAQLVKIKKFSSERKRASKKYYFLCGDFWSILKKIFSARAEAY